VFPQKAKKEKKKKNEGLSNPQKCQTKEQRRKRPWESLPLSFSSSFPQNTKGNNVAAPVEHVYTEALHYVFS